MKLILMLALALSSAAYGDQTLVLLRHAEKMTEVKDPPLTGNGHKRANCMANWLTEQSFANDIKVIYSSNYRRTLETAAPMAISLSVSIRLYDPRKLQQLAAELKTAEESAVIIGHSNTTPMLAGMLSASKITPMEETDYSSFWRVDSTEAVKLDQRLIACK